MGRRLGDKNKPKDKPNFNIKEVRLTMDRPFGKQLKPYRKAKGFTLMEIGDKMDWHYSNISHFENGNPMVGNSIRTAVNYAKALGIRELKIIL